MEMNRVGVPIKCPNCETEFVVVPSIQMIAVESSEAIHNAAGERLTSSDVRLRVEFSDFVIRAHRCAGVQ